MDQAKSRARLFATTALASLALIVAASPAARAQSAAASAPAPDEKNPGPSAVEEVVVTGSLIRRTGVETPSPVTVLTADSMNKAGITTISDAIRSISADNSGTIPSAFSNGFAAGSTGVALRGLTVNSTLVLIDGLRTSNYPLPDDGVRGFVDLSTIPFSAVQQVEVLKDGASSIYGADAVAGVVNIIMKKTFQGIEGDAEFGDTQHGGGLSQRYTLTVGHGDLDTDHYNAYLDVEFQGDERIRTDQRGFPYNTNDLSSIGGNNNIGGQPGNFNGSIYGSVAPATLTNGSVLGGVAIPGAVTQPLRPCGGSTVQSTDSVGNVYCAQNFLNYTDIQPRETRFGVLGRFTAQLDPNTQAWFMASYYQNRTTVDQAPAQIQTGTPLNTESIALPATLSNGQLNPSDPFAAQGEAALINYAFGDIPSRIQLTNHVIRAVAGLKSSLDGWDYQVSLDANRSSLTTVGTGFIYEPTLVSDVESGAYNFIDPASNSAAVRAALAPTLRKTSTYDLDSFDVSATRKLWTLPGGPLSLALGGQFRYEAVNNPDINTNNLVSAGDGTIQPAYAFGHRTVGGVFFELEAPVIKPLVINVSGRYDNYSDVGGNFSPKVGLKYTPIKQIAFRATYSEGFRAPSFAENGANSGVIGYIPYSTAASAPASFNAAHGNDAYTQEYYELNGSTVGNPNIKPETSRSYTLGLILEPNSIFNVSVDYYHISKSNVIGNPNQGAILAAYYAGQPLPAGVTITPDAPDPLYPTALPRPLVIHEPYVNTNSEETDGLDIDLRAKFTLPYDVRWVSDLNFSDIFSFNYDSDGTTYSYVGTQAPYILSSGAGTPKYRANWTNSFTYGRLNVTGTLYFVSSFKETGVDATGLPAICLYANGVTGAAVPAGCNVGETWDFDLTGRYKITDKIEFYGVISDLFDAKPPLNPADYSGGANGNGLNYNPTYAQALAVGRAFKIGFHVKY
jgi:iron complex outermembrane receptor protein